MKSIPFFTAFGVCVAAATLAHANVERVVQKTFTVQPGGQLTVETQGGNIEVVTGGSTEVVVVAKERFRTNSESEADEIVGKLNLKIEQTGANVSAISKYEGSKTGFLHWGSWPPVEVSFKVTVPAQYRADLRTSGGNIDVGDLDGEVTARTSGGDITLGKLSKMVEAHTSGGSVHLKEGLGEVKLGTSGGDVAVGHAVGDAHLRTSGGNISIQSAEGQVDAETSGGNVSAEFPQGVKADTRLGTSGGNVTATVGGHGGYHLDASTSGGDVDATGLTITIEKGGNGKSHLVGDVNGGGPNLRLRTSGGDVRVRGKS